MQVPSLNLRGTLFRLGISADASMAPVILVQIVRESSQTVTVIKNCKLAAPERKVFRETCSC